MPRARTVSILAIAILGSLPIVATATEHPVTCPLDHSDGSADGCRFHTEIPEGAIVHSIGRASLTTFSPLLQDLVDAMTARLFGRYVADLSGENSVIVDGESYTFMTRYSFATGGEKSWVYAYERLAAMGYDVSYQDYTRNGHDLKNVIARLPGEVTPDQVYVLGGHIDSISQDPYNLAPGAEDNGTGSSGVLAAAAVLASQRFESTIEFVLFSGEEEGLWGSRAYVDDALATGKNVVSAVTADMIGYHVTDYGVLIEGETAWSDLMSVVADAVDTYTSLDREFSYYSFGSDHVPFQDAGIPALLTIDLDWDEYPYYHHTTDTFDHVDPGFGVQIARAGMAAVAQLAGPLGSAVDTPTTATPPVPALALFPNPARSALHIAFPSTSDVSFFGVFDLQGRMVRRFPGGIPAGAEGTETSVTWDLLDDAGRRVRPGAYWVRHGTDSRRVLVLR